MKKIIRWISLCCIAALLGTAFAAAAVEAPSDVVDMEAMRRAVLMDWEVDTGNDGSDETPSFQMQPGDGEYLRWYFDNSSWSGRAHVYLYDVNKGEIVSAMSPYVDAGEERTDVYFVGSDSRLCEFRILVESVDGEKIYGRARARQIHSGEYTEK